MTDQIKSSLIEISDDGETVELLDGSIWRIAAGDIPTAILWTPTSEIEVQESDGDLYSHILINRSNDTRVRANCE